MFSKNYLIMILFVGSLLSSGNTSEKEVRNDSHAIVKKFVILGLVGIISALISHSTAYLDTGDGGQLSYLGGIFI